MPTFIFVDISGFTALTETHGDEDASRLVREFVALVRETLPAGGRLVKTIGDAAMIVIDEAIDALDLAQRVINSAESLPGRPAIRVGLHTGEAVDVGDDYLGHAVNVAARVASAARPCEILMTRDVVDALGDAAGSLPLISLGQQLLRNVMEPIVLFSLTLSHESFHTDPVCRMRLSAEESTGSLRFSDRVYYFCSLTCASKFAAAPDAYASGAQ